MHCTLRKEVDRPPEEVLQLLLQLLDVPTEPRSRVEFVQQVEIARVGVSASSNGPEHLETGHAEANTDRREAIAINIDDRCGHGRPAYVSISLREVRPLVSRALDTPARSYLMWIPEIARAITKRWISDVPSKIV